MCFSVLPTIYTSQTQETAPTYHLSLYYRSLPSLLLIANAGSESDLVTNSEVVIEVVRVPLGRIARRLAHLPAALDEATAVSFSAFCASLAFYHATRTQRRFMPSMLSRRWHIFPPKKPV